jgi:hypothetical protein
MYIINPEKSSSQGPMWYLYFEAKEDFIDYNLGVSCTLEPAILRLKKECNSDTGICHGYVFYNPLTHRFQILENEEECLDSYLIGGYIIQINEDCKLNYIYPDCETDSIRNFSGDFNEGFNKLLQNCDNDLDICGQFREDNFSEDYKIGCIEIN